jgi:hypothetical protein
MHAIETLDHTRIRLMLSEFPHNVLAHVTIIFFHLRGDFQLILRRNSSHFSTFTQEVKYELRDVPSGDGNVLDSAADNVAISDGNDVRDTVARVDDCAREDLIARLFGFPRRGEGEYGLDCDVETFDVEGFEEDLCCLFSVLGRVERWFGLCV